MITKRYEQKLEIMDDGRIQCLLSTIVIMDGVEMAPKFHRHVVDVDDDLTNQSERVKAIAPLIWTQEVKAARSTFKANPEATTAITQGIVEKTKAINHVLPSGAIVQQVFDIVEEDGVEVGIAARPNKLIDVEADTTNESEQVKGLALGTWNQEVKAAANARRIATIAEKGKALPEVVATAKAKAKEDTDSVAGKAART